MFGSFRGSTAMCSKLVVSGKVVYVIPPGQAWGSPCSKEVGLSVPLAKEKLFLSKV